MANVTLTKQDVDYISRVVATEVPGYLAKTNPDVYSAMVKAVVDTITNRVASPQYPGTVKDVINQNRQFSKIAGPAKLNPYGKVEKAPKADAKTVAIVSDHLAARAKGLPSTIGASVNYANPNYSDPKNMGWINSMIDNGATKIGEGKAVHYHGLAPGSKAAPEYSIALADDKTPFAPGGLLTPQQGGLFVSAAVAEPMKDTAKGKTTAAYQQAANSMKAANVAGIGGGLLGKGIAPNSGVTAKGAAQVGLGNALSAKPVVTATGTVAQPQPSMNVMGTARIGNQALPTLSMPTTAPVVTSPTIAPQPAPVPAQRAIQQVAPVRAPVQAPVQRTMPVAPQQARNVPSQSFGPPMPSAMDVWSGQAKTGIANNGNVLSERGGNIYSYNPTYDRTSIFNAAGDVVGSFKGQQQQGILGDKGLFSGLSGKVGGMFEGKNSQFGDKARSVAGSLAGGLLGSYVGGPVGGAIGAALGREIAAGRNPMDGGLKGFLSAAAGRGSFPAAPAAPAQTTQNGPGLGMALSQQAKDAIAAGKGGLY